MSDNRRDNYVYNDSVKIYEDYEMNKKNRILFFKVNLVVFSINNIFS